ncbi:peptidoglycan-binding protein [Amycolatopsis sp. NPDC004368]
MAEKQDGPGEVRRGRKKRWLIVTLVAVAVVGTGTVAVIASVAANSGGGAAPQAKPVETAVVKRTNLTNEEKLTGKLSYGPERTLTGRRPGTITWLPAVGDMIDRGEPVYKVDEHPVPLFFGAIPFYRELMLGANDGPDVRQLEENLRDLGFSGFGKPDTKFTAGTATALKKWQKSMKLDQTGTLSPGDVLVDKGPIRISSLTAQPGGDGVSPLLKTTGTDRLVTVEIDVAKQGIVKQGGRVQLSVAGGREASGTVASIGTTATQEKDDQSSPGSEETKATVTITITLDDGAAAGGFDSAPVDVTFTTGTKDNVLAVPVGALLALAEGGYAVEVVEGDQRRVVPVTTGLFANGEVEISGDGLRQGMKVVTTA